MIGLALVLIPVGYVFVYTGLVGDGSAPPGQPKTFSIGTAFSNALSGKLTPSKTGGASAPGAKGQVGG